MENTRAVCRSSQERNCTHYYSLHESTCPLHTHLSCKSPRTVFFLFSDPIQEISRPESDKTLLDGPPRVLQPFLGNRAKVTRAPPNLPLPVKNTMLAAALFPEFLKELAALAQEHSILCYKILGDFEDSCC